MWYVIPGITPIDYYVTYTKVPHRAIMRYFLHYTEPGDVVFDGFGGTGMTGVAAQLCGDRESVGALGYEVLDDGTVLNEEGKPFSRLGARRAVLNDLAPVAAFIARNYNNPVDAGGFEGEMMRVLQEVDDACGWLYLTLHRPTEEQVAQAVSLLREAGPAVLARGPALPWGRVDYTVWSDVFLCPECAGEVILWGVAPDEGSGRIRKEFPCPHCRSRLSKRTMERAWVTRFDRAIRQRVRQARQVPVLIRYSSGKEHYEKVPDAFDLALIDMSDRKGVEGWFPTDPLPPGEKTRDPFSAGITHVQHFYTGRALQTLAAAYAVAAHASPDRVFPYVLFTLQQAVLGMGKVSRYVPNHFSQVNPYLSGTLYIGSQVVDASLEYILRGKIRRLGKLLRNPGFQEGNVLGEARSLTACDLPAETVDYIFTDPPFGGNLMYSELNFLWEAWLKVFTNSGPEAVTSRVRGKGLSEYRELMTRCFREYHRVLKPGRWMTMAFHNSRNSVWNAIQKGLREAGFVIADIRTLDKRQDTFNQAAGGGSVKQDLVISAWKPRGGGSGQAGLDAGTEEGVWEFVRTRLQGLPMPRPGGEPDLVAERQRHLLFDRMVAFHIRRGLTVPLSAPEFYTGLARRFVERDGMYFFKDQLPPGNLPAAPVCEFADGVQPFGEEGKQNETAHGQAQVEGKETPEKDEYRSCDGLQQFGEEVGGSQLDAAAASRGGHDGKDHEYQHLNGDQLRHWQVNAHGRQQEPADRVEGDVVQGRVRDHRQEAGGSGAGQGAEPGDELPCRTGQAFEDGTGSHAADNSRGLSKTHYHRQQNNQEDQHPEVAYQGSLDRRGEQAPVIRCEGDEDQ